MGKHPLITAAELDEMTPAEREAEFAKRVVTDLDDLPAPFRARVEATAKRLTSELHRRSA